MFPSHLMAPYGESSLTIRRATRSDERAIERVAQLDSRSIPAGEVLVADVEGEVVAAKPLDGGVAVADPFRPTAEIVSLLEARAREMRAADSVRPDALARRGLRRALRAW
jgi:hypothetical protein